MQYVEAKVTHSFRATADRVFDAWLQPDFVRVWLSSALKSHGLSGEIRRIEIDPRVGGKFVFSDMRDGKEAVHWGTYLAMERPHKLVFNWFTSIEDEKEGTSVVTLTIEPKGSGCVATIVHRMSEKYAQYIERTQLGWSRMLEHLGAHLTPAT
jgi:uncharacterized protein YndB with AHSA1/START domain